LPSLRVAGGSTGLPMRRVTLLLGIVIGFLVACSPVPILFDRDLVAQAISLQLRQNQEKLATPLKLSDRLTWSVDRVNVTDSESLTIQDLSAYHLQGTYRLTIDLPTGTKTRQNQPFDLYLQGQKEGKSWRLARYFASKTETEPSWKTYLIVPEDWE